MRYDTIRDAILTCARKPTGVGLIYRTETTSKNCKTEKLKSKSRYVRSNSKSLGNHVVSSEEEEERLQWEGLSTIMSEQKAEKGNVCQTLAGGRSTEQRRGTANHIVQQTSANEGLRSDRPRYHAHTR